MQDPKLDTLERGKPPCQNFTNKSEDTTKGASGGPRFSKP